MEDQTSVGGSVDVATQLPAVEQKSDFNFREHISDEYKSSKTLEQYKDLNGLVKSHIELNKMIGSSIRLPKEDAAQEDLDKFYNRLGRPETADKYQLWSPEKLPEGFELDENDITEYKTLAHKIGLTNKQADELRKVYVEKAIKNHIEEYKSNEQKEEEFITKGKEIFGDKYDLILQNTSKIIKENLSEEQKQVLDSLNNEQLLTVAGLLNNLNNKYIKPDSINTNHQPANTLEDQKKELNTLVAKQKTMDAFHPEYDSVSKKIKELYAKGIKRF